jgi:hypothetical protein
MLRRDWQKPQQAIASKWNALVPNYNSRRLRRDEQTRRAVCEPDRIDCETREQLPARIDKHRHIPDHAIIASW